MSFTGDLEHLPIVDIIQLLHAARKSGTLTVHNRKGDNQLVFRDGYIVSANNAHNTVRVGKILVETSAITPEVLEQALAEQQAAGVARKPLITMLLDKGLVNKEEAFKGLEILIEKTVLEVLIWKEGSFTFDVDVVNVSDEYRYIPEKMKREVNLNSQNVLMEALRLYDEKKRDGVLEAEFAEEEELAAPAASVASVRAESGPEISADILGLSGLDQLVRHIPDVFIGLADPEPDPETVERRRLSEAAPGLAIEERDELLDFLLPLAGKPPAGRGPGAGSLALILYSCDPLLTHALTTIGKHDGLLAFATDEGSDLDMIIGQSLVKGFAPLVLFDRPGTSAGEFPQESLVDLRRRIQQQFPHAVIGQLVAPQDDAFALNAFREGVRTVLPRPLREVGKAGFAADFIVFLQALRAFFQGWAGERGGDQLGRLRDCCAALKDLAEPRDVAFGVLKFVAGIFPRALILVVGNEELLADRGFGFGGSEDEGRGETPAPGVRIPLAGSSRLTEVIDGCRLAFGPVADPLLGEQLLTVLGPPLEATHLLLPVASFGKARFLIYADFGPDPPPRVDTDLLEVLAIQGGMVLENALYRKKLQKGLA